MSKITKTFNAKIVDQRKDGGRILISTPAPDRDKDRVIPQGVRIDNYLKNPVVQWGHDYSSPYSTIGRTTNIEVTPEGIIAEFELRPAVNDQDPQNVVRLLWDGGWVKAASIGFLPTKGTKNEWGGMDYSESELLEWSIVSIPANQQALRLAAKGLDMKKTIAVKSPDYRLPDESEDACNARKFAELMEANPELSEDEARAMAAEMCAQEAPADQPSDAPADEPTPDEQQSAKGEGDMAGALQELGGHLQAAAELVNALLQMAAPQDASQDAPADMPAEPMQEGKRISVQLDGKELTTIAAPVLSVGRTPVATKRGRVLSAGNESKLRTAHGAIGEVLAQIGEGEPEQASKGESPEDKLLKELAAGLGDLPKLFRK